MAFEIMTGIGSTTPNGHTPLFAYPVSLRESWWGNEALCVLSTSGAAWPAREILHLTDLWRRKAKVEELVG